MNTFYQKIQNLTVMVCLMMLLTACGNDIKTDLIALDEAVVSTGMSGSELKQEATNIQNARSLNEFRAAALSIRERFERYNRTIEALHFKTDEVRALRNELSNHNRELIDALDEIEQLNLHDDMQLDVASHQKLQAKLERISKKAQATEANMETTLRKWQALGADNGVEITIH